MIETLAMIGKRLRLLAAPLWLPRQFAIRAEGWCYLIVMAFVFAGALLRDINLLMLLFGLLSGPVLYSLWYCWFAPRRLRIERRLPRHVHLGDEFDVEIELHNRHRWLGLWAMVVQDSIRPLDPTSHERPHAARLMFFYIPAAGSRRLRYRARLTRRGLYQFGPLSLSTRFPLGLFRRTVTVKSVATLTVWPRLGRLHRSPIASPHVSDQISRQLQRNRGLVEGDFYGLREWRPGDSRRWIHWRTSARMNQLMVRQFERHRAPDIVILLDLWQPARPSAEQLENVELAASLAATVVAEASRRGGHQLLLAISDQSPQILRGAAGEAIFKRSLGALALARAVSDDHLPALIEKVMSVSPASSHTTLITTRRVEPSKLQSLAARRRDLRAGQWLQKIVCIETSSPKLAEYFEPTCR